MRGANHSLRIRARTPSTDAEGRVSYTNSDTTVQGHVSVRAVEAMTPDSRGQFVQQLRGVALVPLGTTVTDNDQVVVTGVNTVVNGTYDIDTVQYTRVHLRLALRGNPT